MKKQLPTHDDTPSVPLAPKKIETQAPNHEGDVRENKYEVEEHISIHTDTQPTSKSVKNTYPIPDNEVDIYAVDTRIWDRMGELLDGAGGDAGPHTHNNYADKQTLEDHLANHPEGGGDGYDDTALTARVKTNETDIASLKTKNISQDENISNNTTALADKADKTHTHDTTHNHNGLYSPTTHLHNDNYADKTAFEEHLANHPSGGGGGSGDTLKIMTQAEYDALENPDPSTLYVVM